MSRVKALVGAGLFWLVVIAFVVAWVSPAALVLQAAGFRDKGAVNATEGRFGGAAPDALDHSAVLPAAATAGEPLAAVTVEIWFLDGPRTFRADEIFARSLVRDHAPDGAPVYTIEFSEDGLNCYLTYWFRAYADQELPVRNLHVALRRQALVLYGDVDLKMGSQRVGAVFNLDADGRQLKFAGLEIGGRLYEAPPDGPLASAIADLESNANRALRELTFVDPAGRLTIQSVRVDADGARIDAGRP